MFQLALISLKMKIPHAELTNPGPCREGRKGLLPAVEGRKRLTNSSNDGETNSQGESLVGQEPAHWNGT